MPITTDMRHFRCLICGKQVTITEHTLEMAKAGLCSKHYAMYLRVLDVTQEAFHGRKNALEPGKVGLL